MLKNLLKRIFNKPASQKEASAPGQIVKVDLDQIGPDAQQEFAELARETSGLTFFNGRIEHGYSLRQVSSPQKCPRCHAPTQQHYAEWIYATQVAPRVMVAPAGYFCTRCPTVIVDEAMIQLGIKKQFRYQGVLGLDYQKSKAPDLFRTWNGKAAVHILDEQGIPQGISTLGSPSLPRTAKPHPPSAKKAKKQGRRKK